RKTPLDHPYDAEAARTHLPNQAAAGVVAQMSDVCFGLPHSTLHRPDEGVATGHGAELGEKRIVIGKVFDHLRAQHEVEGTLERWVVLQILDHELGLPSPPSVVEGRLRDVHAGQIGQGQRSLDRLEVGAVAASDIDDRVDAEWSHDIEDDSSRMAMN